MGRPAAWVRESGESILSLTEDGAPFPSPPITLSFVAVMAPGELEMDSRALYHSRPLTLLGWNSTFDTGLLRNGYSYSYTAPASGFCRIFNVCINTLLQMRKGRFCEKVASFDPSKICMMYYCVLVQIVPNLWSKASCNARAAFPYVKYAIALQNAST